MNNFIEVFAEETPFGNLLTVALMDDQKLWQTLEDRLRMEEIAHTNFAPDGDGYDFVVTNDELVFWNTEVVEDAIDYFTEQLYIYYEAALEPRD